MAAIPRGHGLLPAHQATSRSAPAEMQLLYAEVKDVDDVVAVSLRCAGPVDGPARPGWELEWWVNFQADAAGFRFLVRRSADQEPQAMWSRLPTRRLDRSPQWGPTKALPVFVGNEVRLTLCADEFAEWAGDEVVWSAGTKWDRAGVDGTHTCSTDAVVLRRTPVSESIFRLPSDFPLPPGIGAVTYSDGAAAQWRAYPKQGRDAVVGFFLRELPGRGFRAEVIREWTVDRGTLKFENTALSFAGQALQGAITVSQVFTASGYAADTILTIRPYRGETKVLD